MVKSGLVDIPRVSHYRLAAHLSLAFIIFGYLFWLILDLLKAQGAMQKSSGPAPRLARSSFAITMLIFLQVIYGAFVAGSRAGFGYNTFPLMNGRWMPDEIVALSPLWLNFFENTSSLQFIHRSIAWVLCFAILAFWAVASRQNLGPRQRIALHFLFGTLAVQFVLGVFTLIQIVPLGLAVAHQAGALVLFAAAMYVNHTLLEAGK
jgi:cytochrome c oxidase assembly protein subunit 15